MAIAGKERRKVKRVERVPCSWRESGREGHRFPDTVQRRIMKAIEELLSEERPKDAEVH